MVCIQKKSHILFENLYWMKFHGTKTLIFYYEVETLLYICSEGKSKQWTKMNKQL